MNTYTHRKNAIGFDDKKREPSWIRFDRLRDGKIAIDKYGEPALTAANTKQLIEWLKATKE